MRKFLKKSKFVQKYFGDDVDIKMKMGRMVFVLIMLALIPDILFNFFALRQRGVNVIAPLVGIGALIVAFLLSDKVKSTENMAFYMLLPVNLILFPISFIYGGGAGGGESMWILVGTVLTFLLLNGWRLWFMLICATVSFRFAHMTLGLHPELSQMIDSPKLVQINSAVSLIAVSIIVGVLFRYQNTIYDEQKKLSEQRAKEIEENAKSQSMFFANMNHELRTPINTIIGLNEMTLREENISDEIFENSINIQNASKILLSLINDILDLSKIESGKMEIVPTQYETASMLSDLVNIIWVRANQKKLDFKIDVSEDIPSMLYGDEVRIKQILTNILTNAVKYTEKGSVVLSVTAEQVSENRVRLKMIVEDTGIGIRKESLSELFTVFKRVDEMKTKKIEGTGLGLSISKQLVDMMGGTIKVDSIYQKGSVFTVELEQDIVDSSPLGALQYAVKKGGKQRETYKQRFTAPSASVLVVDDNEMNLMVAKKLLKGTEVDVDTAISGREALEKTKEKFYHCILMDHMMPDMDGEETLKHLRESKDGYCQKTPVIALTANVMANAAKVYMDKGFDAYLSKPISGPLLEAAIQKFLPSELIEFTEDEFDNEDENVAEISRMVFHKKKKRMVICADCVCDIPKDWVREHDVKLMYYYLVTEEGRFIDTQEIVSEEVLYYMATGKSVRSECASVEEYEKFFADRLTEAEQVIHITICSRSSKGYEAACKAAEGFDNVTVFDSGHLSSGMGLMVMNAATMQQEGASRDEIINKLIVLREKTSTSFIVPSAESMYRGGRVSKFVYKACEMLLAHPVLYLKNSKITLKTLHFGKINNAAKSYIRETLLNSRKIDDGILFITHAGLTTTQLETIKSEALKYKNFKNVIFQTSSATVSSNCGLGCFGLLFVRK